MTTRSLVVSVAAACLLGVSASVPVIAAEYPDKEWTRNTPAEAGLDADTLDEFSEYVGGRGCVVRHGRLVYDWGDVGKRGDVASACKPWYTHFLIEALEDGRIKGIDGKVARWEPRLKDLNEDLDHKDRRITWRHLANQTSCYGVREKPGAAFDYSDYNMALFFDTLFREVWGATYRNVDEKVLRPRLTDVLQCQDEPTFMAFGRQDRPGRLAVSCRDFARFGLLYLRGGRWKEKQLISQKHVRLVTRNPVPNSVPRTQGRRAEMIDGQRSIGGGNNQTDHMGSYSYAWWTNGVDREGRRHWPDAPHDTYGAFGHGGRRAMVIVPRLRLIVSWNDSRVRGRDMENEALRRLVAAVTTDTPKANQEGNAQKTARLSSRWAGNPGRSCCGETVWPSTRCSDSVPAWGQLNLGGRLWQTGE